MDEGRLLTRRALVGRTAGLAAALATLPAILERNGWLEDALAADADLVDDTLNGLVALVVPGDDRYSVAQGVSAGQPGGIAAGTTPVLRRTLDRANGFDPAASATVAAVLNGYAAAVNPAAQGEFTSLFARLSFAEKAATFAYMEGDPSAEGTLRYLAGTLPGLVGFLAYSEAGVLDPATRTLTGRPVGWTLSGYAGVADTRNEFKGYLENRRRADA